MIASGFFGKIIWFRTLIWEIFLQNTFFKGAHLYQYKSASGLLSLFPIPLPDYLQSKSKPFSSH